MTRREAIETLGRIGLFSAIWMNGFVTGLVPSPRPVGPKVLSGIVTGQNLYSPTGFRLAPGAVVTQCVLRAPADLPVIVDAREWWSCGLPGTFDRNVVMAEKADVAGWSLVRVDA